MSKTSEHVDAATKASPPRPPDPGEIGELRPIGAIATELELTPGAIRYYEELGLLDAEIARRGQPSRDA